MSDFETWWQQEGQEFLYALNTTTDDDIKLVAEVAWKNGAYCAEQADGEQWSSDDMAYRPSGLSMEQAEQEPVAWHHPQCDGQCIACLIEKTVQDAYGTQGRDYMLRHIKAAPVRTKDLTDDEIVDASGIGCALPNEIDRFRAVIAADREKNRG